LWKRKGLIRKKFAFLCGVINLQPGSLLKIDFDVESREFNGRWYTDVKAWKIEVAGNSALTGSEKVTANMGPENTSNDDDLPF
jgi:hypothetical protein